MKRTIGLMVFALLAVGCATNSSVKEQIAPLSNKITSIEQRQMDLDARLADISKKQDAQAADIAQAQAAAQKAQQAASDAQAAATRAEDAAAKSTKAFALGQKKGK